MNPELNELMGEPLKHIVMTRELFMCMCAAMAALPRIIDSDAFDVLTSEVKKGSG